MYSFGPVGRNIYIPQLYTMYVLGAMVVTTPRLAVQSQS